MTKAEVAKALSLYKDCWLNPSTLAIMSLVVLHGLKLGNKACARGKFQVAPETTTSRAGSVASSASWQQTAKGSNATFAPCSFQSPCSLALNKHWLGINLIYVIYLHLSTPYNHISYHLSISLSVDLSIYLSTYLSIYLSLSLSLSVICRFIYNTVPPLVPILQGT